MSKSDYIAYVGGTIGMKRLGRHYQPLSGFLQQQMDADPAFRHPDLPD